MLRFSLHGLGRSLLGSAAARFNPVANDSQTADLVDVQGLEERLQAAHALAQPGFMALHAVREDGDIIDFEWDTASVEATRLLTGSATSLVGERLVEVLACSAGRGNVFNQYRQVVEFGAARAVQQGVGTHHSVDVLRHAAVRLHDGVAVTLTNVTALRRELALRREIRARTRMSFRAPHRMSLVRTAR